MEAVVSSPVTFTATAISEIKNLMHASDFDTTQFLRIGVKGGGCSGMTYVLAFDHKEEDDDIFYTAEIPCVMKKAHSLYLLGMEIDWQNGLNNRGFSFSNPNASSTCGCGTSFSV
jgi:iron-sulfur cluster assembly protein